MNYAIFVLAALLLALSAASHAAEPPSSRNPNVLLIISDDQGYGDFGFTGNKLVRTPRLDRLARESAVFTNFVVAAACSPSRSAIWTGRDHLLTGVWGVPPRANLRRDETLMPAFFKAAGYRTLHVGKGDCVRIHESQPWQRGWDNAFLLGGGYLHRDPQVTHKGGTATVKGWTADIVTDGAIEFIRARQGEPWFAGVAYIIPHMPWVCDEKHSAPFVAQGCSAELAACYGSIAHMDECIGRLLDALHATGQQRRTIVAFVSDNGQAAPQYEGADWDRRNVAKLRGHKATVWENGIRVPFAVQWPERISPGPRAQFGCAEDILPTLLDLARIDPGQVPHQPFTGVSLRPALQDAATTFERPAAFRTAIAFEGSPRAPTGIVADTRALEYEAHHLALRGPRFKYHALPGGKAALYDLATDPGETTDVQAKFADVASNMASQCRQRWEAVIASGRAFRMPTVLVGSEAAAAPPNNRSNLPCTAAQTVTGKVRIARDAEGFATAGDSVTYALDVVAPGRYQVMLQGEGCDSCAPLTLNFGGKVLQPRQRVPKAINFGSVELKKGESTLRIVAGTPTQKAQPAKLRSVVFQPVAQAGAGSESQANLEESFNGELSKDWFWDLGTWTVKEGILRGYESGPRRHGPVKMRRLSLRDGAVECEFRLEGKATFAGVIFNGSQERGHIVHVVMSKDRVRILAHPTKGESVELLSEPQTLAVGQWHRVSIVLRGPQIAATVNGNTFTATHACIAEEKLSFGMGGDSGGPEGEKAGALEFRKLRISGRP